MKKLFLPLLLVVCLVGDTSTRAITATTSAGPAASQLSNISTRSFVQTGDNVMIGGFIVQGTQPKKVIIRAIGPELGAPPYNIPNALADPILELHDGTGALIATNDNWQHTIIGGIITASQVAEIQNSGHAPRDPSESAIIADLPPGNYTAIVRGKNIIVGVALVEVYDLSPGTTSPSILANISTRSFVQTGDNVMIGGFIIEGTTPKTVIVRAIGPGLTQYGVPNALANPTLELHNGTGALIASNDNWRTTIIDGIITSNQASAIQDSGLAPGDGRESAIMATLPPGNYTAIVSGVNNTTGVALVEVYDLTPVSLIGAFNFPGPYPPITEVTYNDNSGHTFTTATYSGQVVLFVQPAEMNASAATQLIQMNGGTIIAQIPSAGIYWAHVASGSEGTFITAVYANPSVIYAAPNVPLTASQTSPPVDLSGSTFVAPLIPGPSNLISQFDFFGLQGPRTCGLSHGFAVNRFATQNNQGTSTYDITNGVITPGGGGPVFTTAAPSDLGFGMLRTAEGARISGQKLIVNASIQSSAAPNDQMDRSICETNPFAGVCSCAGIPALPNPPCGKAPNSNYESWKSAAFQQLAFIAAALEFQRDDLLNNTMVVVSAGNGGLDMTFNGIDLLPIFFPKAFAHMIIVGTLNSPANGGQPYFRHNHSTNPTRMLYAPGVDVEVPGTGGCRADGTSFAAPAVTNLASQLAHAFPTLTTAQLKRAIERAAPIVSGGLRAMPTFQAAANEARLLTLPTYRGNFSGFVIDNCSFPGTCTLRDTVSSAVTLYVTGSGTPSDPYSGTADFSGTLVITLISGPCHGDTISATGTGVVSGSAGRVIGHIEFDVRGSHVTVDLTDGVISGNNLTGSISINLGFCVPPITGTVTLTRSP